ncbi:hypothetical protein OAB85_03490 [Pseudomonadales bacterium]|nr:hypothetical protein [Pseudomonadales bacterium]
MDNKKEKLTALAIEAAGAEISDRETTDLALRILKAVDDRLVGSLSGNDVKAAEQAIIKEIKIIASGTLR